MSGADESREESLVLDLQRFTEEMLGSKIPLDPNDGWKHASDWEPVKERLRAILQRYGDARRTSIAIEFDRAKLAATWSLYEAGSGRALREPADILRVLQGRSI